MWHNCIISYQLKNISLTRSKQVLSSIPSCSGSEQQLEQLLQKRAKPGLYYVGFSQIIIPNWNGNWIIAVEGPYGHWPQDHHHGFTENQLNLSTLRECFNQNKHRRPLEQYEWLHPLATRESLFVNLSLGQTYASLGMNTEAGMAAHCIVFIYHHCLFFYLFAQMVVVELHACWNVILMMPMKEREEGSMKMTCLHLRAALVWARKVKMISLVVSFFFGQEHILLRKKIHLE